MSVELEPAELGFKRPFTQEVSQNLRLRNPTSDSIAFKVKTTAPKQYCVRPNSGLIASGKDVDIQVLLQPMKEDPPEGSRCRDKFLVQTVAVDSTHSFESAPEVWQHIETTAKSSIQERKIRVVWHDSASGHNAAVNGINTAHSPSPSQAQSPRTPINSNADTQSSTTFNSAHAPDVSHSRDASRIDDSMQSTATSIKDTAAGTATSIVNNVQAGLQQAADASAATISNIRDQVSDQGVRQRKVDAVSQDTKEKLTSATSVHAPTSNGIPVQVVVGLCLLCFVLAWYLF